MAAFIPGCYDNSMSGPLLEIRRLAVHFQTARGIVPAVQDVSLEIAAGEVVGLVGESGCGKSVTALSILRLLPDNARIASGELLFRDSGVERDLRTVPEAAIRAVRGARISMIFQEPMTALNPVMKVGDQIAEALMAHGEAGRGSTGNGAASLSERSGEWDQRAARAAALEMLRQVAVTDPERRLSQYPHQLSGGLRQRVMIAMALVCGPRLLIADEPTTALDVTIQAQILALLAGLRERFGLALLFISHDLGGVAQIADRVAVMYAGRIVEYAPVRELFASPAHPYTRGLIRAAPSLQSEPRRRLATIEGLVPDPRELPPGCAFAPRCEFATGECRAEVPHLVEIASGHWVRCIHPQ